MTQHILFVDDEIPIRETLALCFKMKGIAVTTAGTGREALRLCEGTCFNLVILDVKLGEESGLELLEHFKRNNPKPPVIMFTSLGDDPALVKQALAKGANAYMSKSDSLDNLLREAEAAMQSPDATVASGATV